jgi:hypothetical protein
MATTAPKTVKKTTATTKKPAEKKAPVKKAAAPKKTTTKSRKIGAEERYRMIEVAAYYLAENNSFQGNTLDYWIAAEMQVDAMLK